MRKCKITVIKKTFNEDLAKEYARPLLGLCERHQVGQVFYADWQKPDGLCDEAWKAMHHYVMALAHGAHVFYDGDWVKENLAICSCNDGIRPVIFKIEPVENESESK
jgi:uncharacterized repeat protein (TIGR04076 family)